MLLVLDGCWCFRACLLWLLLLLLLLPLLLLVAGRELQESKGPSLTILTSTSKCECMPAS
jgi:hypothetical protein